MRLMGALMRLMGRRPAAATTPDRVKRQIEAREREIRQRLDRQIAMLDGDSDLHRRVR